MEGHGLGEVDGLLLGFAEEGAVLPVAEGGEVLGLPAKFEADGGVAGEAVGGAVELRGADDDELLEARGKSAGGEDGLHVRDHGLEDLWAVSDGAKEVGDVAALLEVAVVDAAKFGADFGAIEPADAWHGSLLGCVDAQNNAANTVRTG